MIETEMESILLQDTYDKEKLAKAIIDQYYSSLHFLAFSILGNSDDADDAVQQTIIRALNNIESLRPDGNVKAWFSIILINQCRDMLRRQKARHRLGKTLQRLLSIKSPRKQPEEKAIKNEAIRALWEAVNRLDEKHRLPVILRYVHNMQIKEIAKMLQIRDGTVHSRLHNACRKLGQNLVLYDQEKLVRELFRD